MSGPAIALTPMTRATRIVQSAPRSWPAFALPTSPIPKLQAAAIAYSDGRRWMSVAAPRSVTTKIPSAITARQRAIPAVRRSPSAIESSAASAPSVEAIGATTPTLPMRRARYIIESPKADPTPAATAQAQAEPDAPCGTPASGVSASVSAPPISITQASAPWEPRTSSSATRRRSRGPT